MKKLTKGCLIATGVILVLIGCVVELINIGGGISERAQNTAIPNVGNLAGQAPESTIEGTAEQSTEKTIEQPAPTETAPSQEVALVDNGPSFEEICANSTTGGRTEVRWDNFKKNVNGTYFVNRVGVVEDVSQGLFGGYTLRIGVGESYGSCSVDVRIGVSEEESLQIEKDQKVLFTGKISSISEFFSDVSVSIGDATFTQDSNAIEAVTGPSVAPKLGTIGEKIECGNSFSLTVLDQPEYFNAIGYGNQATGKVLVLKLEIVNNTSETIDGLNEDYFSVEGSLNRKPTTFITNWDASYDAAKRQAGYKYFGDDMPPGLPWRTQVAFDINPDAKNLVFVFAPRGNYFDSNNMCEARIALSE
jgi:hypothetical protein